MHDYSVFGLFQWARMISSYPLLDAHDPLRGLRHGRMAVIADENCAFNGKKSDMTDIYVVGVSMTPFGKFLDKSVKALTAEAVAAALKDAGCGKEAIGSAFFANAAQSAMAKGQYMVGGQIALRAIGFTDLPIFNVENACASASTAFNLACTQLKAGECDVALAVGAEKMYSHDKARTFEVFNGAWDVHEVDSLTRNLLRLAEGVGAPPGTEDGGTRSVFHGRLCRTGQAAHGALWHDRAPARHRRRQESLSLDPQSAFRNIALT